MIKTEPDQTTTSNKIRPSATYSQITQGLAWYRIRVSVVTGRLITAWVNSVEGRFVSTFSDGSKSHQ